jgi:hypothetical protein
MLQCCILGSNTIVITLLFNLLVEQANMGVRVDKGYMSNSSLWFIEGCLGSSVWVI